MKKKVAVKVELYKIQKGVELPKKRGAEMSEKTKLIYQSLKEMGVGDSFLVDRNQEPTVRILLKKFPKTFKDYNVTIRKATEGREYRRVFRVQSKEKK